MSAGVVMLGRPRSSCPFLGDFGEAPFLQERSFAHRSLNRSLKDRHETVLLRRWNHDLLW
jgi:hypothetical protein